MSDNKEYVQQLLSEARSGSRASMGRLAVIVWERLYPFVLRTTFNHDLTEDVIQETLLVMVRQVNSLRGGRRFWAWVYRIAWSKVQDIFRRRRIRSSGKAWLKCHARSHAQGAGDNLLEEKIQQENLREMMDVVEQLSHQHRDVLRLRYYEQLPYDEIASMTCTTPQMARVRFHRAKKFLKKQLLCGVK